MIKVFISYSHDSDVHRERVLGLSERLRDDGIETILDRYVERGSPPEGWPRWMLNALDAATHVLCVCTESYYRRFRGHEEPNKGKGVDWEGAVITQELYDARHVSNKFIPVLFDPADELHIPEPLRSQTYYVLNSETNYQGLYDALLNQSGVKPGAIGELKLKPRITGQPLRFDVQSPESCSPILGKAEALRFDISPILRHAPAQLIGRENEIALLNDAWGKVMRNETGRPRIITFVALGGEGKTSLVAKWVVDEMLDKGWHDCNAAFAWSFYNQGTREQLAASSDLFLKEALIFFGDDADKDFAASSAGAYEKGQRLARIVGQRRNLLILDGLEPLQYAPASPTPGELKDQGIAALLKGLAQNSRGLCVITTRYELRDLRAFLNKAVLEKALPRLSLDAGVHLLKTFDVRGTAKEFEVLVEDVKGHALTLTLLGGFLKRAFHGDIRQRDLVKFDKADEKIDGGHAFRTMAAYEKWLLRDGGDEGQREVAVLRLIGLFDRPANVGCLETLRREIIPGLNEPLTKLSDDDWEFCLSGLEAAKLLTVSRDISGALISLDAHPLLREYFAKQLREQYPDAWRAAHRRLYEYLCASTPDKPQPNLEDLQPLYQAVAHGCQAGLQQEAHELHLRRIRRTKENYACNKLGAFGTDLGAIACFFEQLWLKPSANLSLIDQAGLLNNAAFRLRALGRLKDALESVRNAVESVMHLPGWIEPAKYTSNLSDLELLLGDVVSALGNAERSVVYADLSRDGISKMETRIAHAYALHQAGRFTEAEARFHEVERMVGEIQKRLPDHLVLLGQEFRHWDLLLVGSERAAWLLTCNGELRLPEQNIATCRASLQVAYQRAKKIFKNNISRTSLLDTAFDHLALGRTVLFKAILANVRHGQPNPKWEASRRELDSALDWFRRSGNLDVLPLGLLSRAWLRFLEGKYTGSGSAQADLDEAWEIAERGPMKLHIADIHLYRARLFGSQRFKDSGLEYPWDSLRADLETAEELIDTCGYHRRDEELADAKRALLD
jgi:tetratricopeptide (TPR) repeat protein